MHIKCPRCQYENPATKNVCEKCGFKIPDTHTFEPWVTPTAPPVIHALSEIIEDFEESRNEDDKAGEDKEEKEGESLN